MLFLRLGAIGDTTLLLPTLLGVLDNQPSIELHVIVWSSNISVYNLIHSPRLFLHNLGSYRSLLGLWNLFKFSIKERGHFDVVFDMEQFANLFAIVGLILRPRCLIGFDVKGQSRKEYYGKTVLYDSNIHESLNFLSMVHAVFPEARMFHDPPKRELNPADFIAIHPGSKWPQKRWPMERFVGIFKKIHLQYPLIKIRLYMGPDELLSEETIPDYVERSIQTPLERVFDELSQCRLMISNDNGIMHVAGWMGIPVIGIFGMSDPIQWHALGNENNALSPSLDCAPCNKLGQMRKCNDFKCLKNISIDDVMRKVVGILGD